MNNTTEINEEVNIFDKNNIWNISYLLGSPSDPDPVIYYNADIINDDYFEKNWRDICIDCLKIEIFCDDSNKSIKEYQNEIEEYKNQTDDEIFFNKLIFADYDQFIEKTENKIKELKENIEYYSKIIEILKQNIKNFTNYYNIVYIKYMI